MKNNFKVFVGVILLVIGSLLLIDRVGLLSAYSINLEVILSLFWPLIITALGVKLFIDRNATWGFIITMFGSVMFLSNLFNWDFFAILWPLIIISIGVSILIKREDNHITSSEGKIQEDRIEETFSFSDSKRKITSQSFKGGRVTLSFGELELDLREAKLNKDGAKLEVSANFGEVRIYVPKNCRVLTKGSVFLGSWNPKLEKSSAEKPVLEITGNVSFGEVNILD